MSTINPALIPNNLDGCYQLREQLLDLLAEVGARIEDMEDAEASAEERESRRDYRASVL